ncbi:hypothetical protein A3A79_04835 [Candidatus Gottesmanbacteria bacterium RIFCSPLOWO2_01_FULL_43_11b]|uniref:Uncharacterized protein n=1 Tax=Candidatus Gottesmanbacteria bacterium RIFCSPLOWO2_01_FULL_43_11b TaxID=1798392 RepID=A0A1F6AIF5_9BACT|nr:MAG: hypothetical protein A3A79_04835 [Candidatus Gottesmanbacteria bacterium RIFCSPLOWO2_01_FULL_43_11b]
MKRSIKKYSDKFVFAAELQHRLAGVGIDSLCMKMYSHDDDVDLVVINSQKYSQAADVLRIDDWKLNNNKSKIRERDKDFFSHDQQKYKIHLHAYFSWNTVPYLDSSVLWSRKRKEQQVFLPSLEDELLIIAVHSLFENMCIVPEEIYYGKNILKNKIDYGYLKSQAGRFHWESGLELIRNKLNNNDSQIAASELLAIRINKLFSDIFQVGFGQIVNEMFAYFFIDWVWCYPKRHKKLYVAT